MGILTFLTFGFGKGTSSLVPHQLPRVAALSARGDRALLSHAFDFYLVFLDGKQDARSTVEGRRAAQRSGRARVLLVPHQPAQKGTRLQPLRWAVNHASLFHFEYGHFYF